MITHVSRDLDASASAAAAMPSPLLGEPGVEVDRQVRPLLLGAVQRHHRDRTLSGERGDLLVGAVPEAHALTMPDRRE